MHYFHFFPESGEMPTNYFVTGDETCHNQEDCRYRENILYELQEIVHFCFASDDIDLYGRSKSLRTEISNLLSEMPDERGTAQVYNAIQKINEAMERWIQKKGNHSFSKQ
ncbi:hypothetical protein TNCV_165451 [Trichonephila clavipes]|nr:hypothetical protein TNCV_165451 [Trichonephila clavipes]